MNHDKSMNNQAQTLASELREALRRGTGRAAILLQKDPQNPELNAELLRACIENLVYDPQCEAIRVPYLCELIRITGQQDTYRDALESRLRTATPDDPIQDIEQIFGILAQFAAQSGNRGAVLSEFVLEAGPKAMAQAVAPDLIRLQGLGAFLACVRRFEPDEDWDWSLIGEMTHALEERDGTVPAQSALREARQADAELDRRIRLVEEKANAPREPEAVPTYDILKAEVSGRRHFPRPWVMNASEQDLERAAEDLLAESAEGRVLAYLAIFRPRRFPGDPTRLFPLLGSTNRHIALSAASVLARISLPAIRNRAYQLIAEGHPDLGARLLRSSHGDGDVGLLTTLLEQAPDDDNYHSIGYSALEAIEHMNNKPPEAAEMLLHIYKNGPCSNCRQRAVRQLATLNSVPDWMAAEGYYDAEPEIAEKFRPSVVLDQ